MNNDLAIKKQKISIKSGRIENSLGALTGLLKKYFQSAADVYAVMDHAVAFGRYENPSIHVVLGSTGKVEDLPVGYVRELRVFEKKQEMRLVRSDKELIWRLLQDLGESEDHASGRYYMDEQHKLWGTVKSKTVCSEEVRSSWSYLTSARGTSLFVYGRHDNGKKIGLKIRNYIEFTDVKIESDIENETGIIHFVDERLIGLEPWEEES